MGTGRACLRAGGVHLARRVENIGPLRQCFTNFYAKVALAEGRGEPVEFLWPLNDPQHPLKAGDSVRFMMALGSDCNKSAGPGLFALGDCKITQQILSAPYLIRE